MRVQLGAANRTSALRSRLGAAACMLLASGAPAVARADSGATTQIDATGLFYGEKDRVKVVEPTVRVTRLFADGQSLSAQLGIDVITGATPSGVLPVGGTQTSTSPSGHATNLPAGQLPLSSFGDTRVALDADWQEPLAGLLTSTLSGHFSREKDYQSLGASGKISAELMHHLVTVTAGAGFNHDGVFAKGGTPGGLTDGSSIVSRDSQSKRVTTALLGISRILTRRWMLAVNGSHTWEQGYLTEPYKFLSLMDGESGLPVGQLTEQRPSNRNRSSLLASSVYHLTDDVLYLSYRYYWDDWGLRSNTYDLKYRHELADNRDLENIFVEPHVRYYSQTPADFFRFALVDGAPLPDFASSDFRLGALKTLTLGATLGFHVMNSPGEWSARAEFMRQTGDSHPVGAVGVQSHYDLFPAISIGSLVIGYSVAF